MNQSVLRKIESNHASVLSRNFNWPFSLRITAWTSIHSNYDTAPTQGWWNIFGRLDRFSFYQKKMTKSVLYKTNPALKALGRWSTNKGIGSSYSRYVRKAFFGMEPPLVRSNLPISSQLWIVDFGLLGVTFKRDEFEELEWSSIFI